MWPLVEGAEVVKTDLSELRMLAERAGMSEWEDDVLPWDLLGGLGPLSETEDPEDWFPPIGPTPFDAAGLLAMGCRLANILLSTAGR
ncbi:hypothetical protein MKZ15_08755 [Paenibacillus sp. FSL R7-0216]|uniref:hypothetical protein n=1 Tax=Paenibacillus sp. FSL R7-0216 TaxID=2921677 RepID=UPI0030DCFC0B